MEPQFRDKMFSSTLEFCCLGTNSPHLEKEKGLFFPPNFRGHKVISREKEEKESCSRSSNTKQHHLSSDRLRPQNRVCGIEEGFFAWPTK